jgi:hypothetical protein
MLWPHTKTHIVFNKHQALQHNLSTKPPCFCKCKLVLMKTGFRDSKQFFLRSFVLHSTATAKDEATSQSSTISQMINHNLKFIILKGAYTNLVQAPN